jgi:hypothetical protein
VAAERLLDEETLLVPHVLETLAEEVLAEPGAGQPKLSGAGTEILSTVPARIAWHQPICLIEEVQLDVGPFDHIVNGEVPREVVSS